MSNEIRSVHGTGAYSTSIPQRTQTEEKRQAEKHVVDDSKKAEEQRKQFQKEAIKQDVKRDSQEEAQSLKKERIEALREKKARQEEDEKAVQKEESKKAESPQAQGDSPLRNLDLLA